LQIAIYKNGQINANWQIEIIKRPNYCNFANGNLKKRPNYCNFANYSNSHLIGMFAIYKNGQIIAILQIAIY
jgi:hypothetical protein